MISTTFDGDDVFLINDPANFAHSYEVTAQTIVSGTEGLTKREGRRSLSDTLRFNIKFSVTTSGDSTRVFHGLSRSLEAHPVLTPFWPGVSSWASRAAAKIIGGLKVAWTNGWEDWEIYTTVEPIGFVPDYVAPLLSGFINRPTNTDVLSPSVAVYSIEFTESSIADYALSFVSDGFNEGPDLAGYADPPLLFPFAPNFKRLKSMTSLIIHREQIGFGREKSTTFYPHEPFENLSADYILSTEALIATVLHWYQTQGGKGASFWAQSPLAVGYLLNDELAGATTITLQDNDAIQINDQLVATFADGHLEYDLVVNKVGPVLTLDAGFTSALPAGTLFRRLALCKLSTKALKLSFSAPFVAKAQLEWSEVRPEVFLPGDETIGETIGRLPQRAYLYDFFWILEATTYHERHTSFERALSNGGNSFPVSSINHGSIRQGLALDNDKVEIKIALADSAVITKMARLSMEVPVFVRILRAGVSGNDAVDEEVIFFGQVKRPSPSGDVARPSCIPGGSKFDRGVPRPNVQRDCNNMLFDEGCALVKADWEFSAEVDNPGTPGYPFTFLLKTLTAPGGFAGTVNADWFARGWIVFGSGATLQRRAILRSTNPVAGALTITIDRDDLDPYPVANDSVTLFPGCGGDYINDCTAKFNNPAQFLGFPFLPMANPTLIKKNQSGAGGKK